MVVGARKLVVLDRTVVGVGGTVVLGVSSRLSLDSLASSRSSSTSGSSPPGRLLHKYTSGGSCGRGCGGPPPTPTPTPTR